MRSLLQRAIREAAATGEVSQATADEFGAAVAGDLGAGMDLLEHLRAIEKQADAATNTADAIEVLGKLKALAGM